MSVNDQSTDPMLFLEQLLEVVERIATTGDLQSVQPLMDMTAGQPRAPLFSSVAEAFARMVVKLEAREFQLECADRALYQAKSAGRNCCRLFEGSRQDLP